MLDMMSELEGVVEIGHVKVPKMPAMNFNYEVPVFCYIIVERESDEPCGVRWENGKYVATCINLQMDGYGATPSAACHNMAINVFEYVCKIFEADEGGSAWDSIWELWLSNSRSGALWDKYNAAQVWLAKNG